MILKNITRKTVIAVDLQYLNSFWGKAVGLLCKKHSHSLYFQTRFGIHTFGLKSPIDVLVLDDRLNVVKSEEVAPNRLFFWDPRYKGVVELPCGSITKSKTARGDQIIILESFLPLPL